MNRLELPSIGRDPLYLGKIRFVPPQLREIGCHVQNHATQWHGFQHEIQLQEIVVAWIKMTLIFIGWGWTYPTRNPVYRSKSMKNPSCTQTLPRPVGPCRTGHSLVPILAINICPPIFW